MEGDLKDIVESTNEDVVLNEEVLAEEVKASVGFITSLNEAFNEEVLSEEEYYDILEGYLREGFLNKFGIGGASDRTSSTTATNLQKKFDDLGAQIKAATAKGDKATASKLMNQRKTLDSTITALKTKPKTVKKQSLYDPNSDTMLNPDGGRVAAKKGQRVSQIGARSTVGSRL